MSFKKVIAVLFMVSSLPAWAGVPYTFTNGQPADATQLNANFSTLVSQIAQLQAQLAALQPVSASTSIVGTWDFIDTDGQISSSGVSYGVSRSVGHGTLTFASNGTVSGTSNYNQGQLDIGINPASVVINNPPYVSYTNTSLSYVTGGATNSPGTDSLSGTYTVSGTTVTMTMSGSTNIQGTISADGRVLVLTMSSNGTTGIIVGLKR